jgi:hypothetical protein
VRFSHRSLGIATILIAIVLAVIVVIAGAAAFVFLSRGSPASTSTTTNSLSTSTSGSVVQPSSSSASTSSGAGKVSIVATNATLDTPDAQGVGDTVYIYFVNFANQGTVTRTIDMFAFTLVTTNGSSFAWKTVNEEHNPLGGQNLLAGKTVSGQLAFEVPLTLTPAKVVYNYTLPRSQAYSFIVSNLPAPTLWVSSFVHSANVVVTGPSANDVRNSAYQIDNQSGNYFYSGQTLAITIGVTSVTGSPAITISGISVSNPGVTIVKVKPSVPATIAADGALSFTVTIMVPASCGQGNLNFTVTAT